MKIPEFSSVINVDKINTKFYKTEYIVNNELEKFKPYYKRLEQDKKEELLPDFIRIVN